MPKPPSEWDEDYILGLPLESDRLERKPASLLDWSLPKTSKDAVRKELAVQLSAFANTSGGQLIYGLRNSGDVDHGGVVRQIKGTSTKEWLESVIPTLVEYEILGVNVFEITAKGLGSKIEKEKGLYVVDVPVSERAPHQSTVDRLYYIRLSSHSYPASHRLIEDIRNRIRHPQIRIIRAEVVAVRVPPISLPRIAGPFGALVKITLKNQGGIKGDNVCVLTVPSSDHFRFDSSGGSDPVHERPGPVPNSIYWELQNPIYPEMETDLQFWCDFHAELREITEDMDSTWERQGSKEDVSEMPISVKIFADSAPPSTKTLLLRDLGLGRRAVEMLRGQAAWEAVSKQFMKK